MVAGESVGDTMVVDVAMGFRIWKAQSPREEDDRPGAKILCAVGKEFLGRVVSDSYGAGGVLSEGNLNDLVAKSPPNPKEVSSADSFCHTVTPVGEEKQDLGNLSPAHLPFCPSLVDDKHAAKALSGQDGLKGQTGEVKCAHKSASFACECHSLVSVVDKNDCVSDVDVGTGGDEDAPASGEWLEAWALAQREALAKLKQRGHKSRVGFVGVPEEDELEKGGKDGGSQGSAESQAGGSGSNSNTDNSDTCARSRPSEHGASTIAGARRRRRGGSGLWSSDETEEGASCSPGDRDWAKKRRMTEGSASSPESVTTIRVVVPGMTPGEVVQRARLQMASPGFPLKIRVRVSAAPCEGQHAGLSVDVDMNDTPETPVRCKAKAPQTPRSAVAGKKSRSRLDMASPLPPTPGSVSRRHSSCGSAAEMMPSPRPASTPSRRNSTSYGINDFCGLAQAKRIEILKCKDIFCPQWRVLEPGAGPTTGRAGGPADGGCDSSDEDDDDGAYEGRHAAHEVKEKLITLPVVQKRRAAHAPRMQDMPAVSEAPTPRVLSRRNSMTSLKQGRADKSTNGTSSSPPSRRPSLSGAEFLRELNGIQIMDHKTGLPTEAFTLATAPIRKGRSMGTTN